MEALAGISIILLVLFDVFQSIIVPRCTSRTLRVAPFLVGKILWPAVRSTAKFKNSAASEFLLGSFGSLAFLSLIITWLLMLTCGYAFLLQAMRSEITPAINDFGSALYFAGTSILTLGYGDFVAVGTPAKAVVLAAAINGIAIMALAVSFLFSLQSSVQKRETMVNTIEARAGEHPSGLILLLNYARFDLTSTLNSSFLNWEMWVAEIFESHRAFPFLAYFRSSQCSFTWITAVGALLDAANLLGSSINGPARGEAKLFETISIKAMESLCEYLQLSPDAHYTHITRPEFAMGLHLLKNAGYDVISETEAWHQFTNARIRYAGLVNALARHFASAMPAWMEEEAQVSRRPENELLVR